MESAVGSFGREVRSHSNTFANIANRGVLRAQINALKAKVPNLELDPTLPRGSFPFGDGYALLLAMELTRFHVSDREAEAIRTSGIFDYSIKSTGSVSVCRWARLLLPNGQVSRCAWKEKSRGAKAVRCARNVKACTPRRRVILFLILFSHRLFTMTKNGLGKCTSSTAPASGGTNGSPSHSSCSTQLLTLLSWKYHQVCCSCVGITEMTPLSWLKRRPSSLLLRWCLSWRSLRVADRGVTMVDFSSSKSPA